MTTVKASLKTSKVYPQVQPPRLDHVRSPTLRIRQAVRDNNVSLLSRLQHKYDLRNTDKNRLTSLSWAAIEGNLEVFEWLLLDWGHDDQELSRDGDNNTILHLLASLPTPPSSHSHHSLLPPLPPSRSLEETRSIAIRMLELYHTLFPFLLDWSNSGGKTPVHVAAQAGNADFIGVLVELGADVDLTDLQGNSPLHYASAWGHLDTVQILLEAGCSMSGKNAEGFTAVDYSFSDRAAVTLQTTARAVWEDRQNRQKEDMKRFEASDKRERTRSGSVSTSYSGTQSVTASSALSGSGQGSQGGYASPHAQLIAREHCFDQSQSQQDFAPPAPSNHRSLGPSRTSSQIGIGTALPNSSLPSLTNSSPKPPPPPPSKSPPIPTLRPISTQPFVLGPPVGQASADPGNSATMRRVNSAQVGAPDRDGTVTMRRAGSGLEATVTRR